MSPVPVPAREALHDALAEVERLAHTTRLGRLAARPRAYLTAVAHRAVAYRLTARPLEVRAATFFGHELRLPLPAGTDVYLTGGKSHDSELRLARYLLRVVAPGASVLDVGAHLGYFALLAGELVGPTGHVHALEASPTTYALLAANVAPLPQVRPHACAAAAEPGELTFYEFDALHSEYNALDVQQYRGAGWFAATPPREVRVPATSLDVLCGEYALEPELIKIDVEGAELEVLRGAADTLVGARPIVVLEYLSAARGDGPHGAAAELLRDAGYRPHRITASGHLAPVSSAAEHVRATGVESDNVVFAA